MQCTKTGMLLDRIVRITSPFFKNNLYQIQTNEIHLRKTMKQQELKESFMQLSKGFVLFIRKQGDFPPCHRQKKKKAYLL